MSYLGRGLDKISNIEVLDNITFDGSSSYSITKSSVAFTPNSAQSLLISIDGVVQATNFTVSSSTIDFGVAVPSTSTCDFFLHYGTGVAFIPADGTVTTAKLADSSVSLAKLTATGTKDATTFLRGDNTFASAGSPSIVDNGTATAITIDSSNRVGIGTTSPVRKLQISNGFIGASESSANITSNQYNEFSDNSANWYNTKFQNYAVSPASHYMIEIGFRSSSPDNGSAQFMDMNDSTTTRCKINSDGDVYNHDGTYGTISDERIKQNIVDASSQWEDIKNIRVRKYKKKDDVLQYGEENAPTEIGVISQELETVSPGLIKEQKPNSSHAELHEDFAGENPQNVKYVKYSILYMKSIKALQEAMERIEKLETKNTELEARITTLENA